MSKVYYSYYNLVRKPNTAFDCLKGIAVFYYRINFQVDVIPNSSYPNDSPNPYIIIPEYQATIWFMPIADVYQGALIRGDELKNHGGEFWPLDHADVLPGGRYSVTILSSRANGVYPGTTNVLIGDSNGSRFTKDFDECTVTLNAEVPTSVFAAHLQSQFNLNFPNQSVKLTDLDPDAVIGEKFTMQYEPTQTRQHLVYSPIKITGDPITAPLQTIDFNAGQ